MVTMRDIPLPSREELERILSEPSPFLHDIRWIDSALYPTELRAPLPEVQWRKLPTPPETWRSRLAGRIERFSDWLEWRLLNLADRVRYGR